MSSPLRCTVLHRTGHRSWDFTHRSIESCTLQVQWRAVWIQSICRVSLESFPRKQTIRPPKTSGLVEWRSSVENEPCQPCSHGANSSSLMPAPVHGRNWWHRTWTANGPGRLAWRLQGSQFISLGPTRLLRRRSKIIKGRKVQNGSNHKLTNKQCRLIRNPIKGYHHRLSQQGLGIPQLE